MNLFIWTQISFASTLSVGSLTLNILYNESLAPAESSFEFKRHIELSKIQK